MIDPRLNMESLSLAWSPFFRRERRPQSGHLGVYYMHIINCHTEAAYAIFHIKNYATCLQAPDVRCI